jgi:hypothetical protein
VWKAQSGIGYLYDGDCRVGDREATPAEVAAWEAARAEAMKPKHVPAGDFVAALYQLGWLEDVKAAVAAAGGLAAELWAHASSFERNHPLVAQIATAIGKSQADLDSLFLLAQQIGAARQSA